MERCSPQTVVCMPITWLLTEDRFQLHSSGWDPARREAAGPGWCCWSKDLALSGKELGGAVFSCFLLTKLHRDSWLGKPSFCTADHLLTLSPASSLYFNPFCCIGKASVSPCRCKGLHCAVSLLEAVLGTGGGL